MDELFIITSIISPLLGVIVGASSQYFLNKINRTQEAFMNLKIEFYIDFITYKATLARLKKDDKAIIEVLTKNDISKYKICIYGSEKVVEKLTAFERLDINLEENLCKQRFMELCNEMRKDSNSKELNSKDLRRGNLRF
jgi:hypothetical protein